MRPKTPQDERTAKLLRRRQAELGLTHAELAERITANGYEVSDETVRRWTHTGAIPLAVLALGRSAIAAAYEIPKELLGMQNIHGTTVANDNNGMDNYDSNDPALFVKLIDQQLERLTFMARYLADDEIRECDLLKPLDLLETDPIIDTAEQVKISMEIINKQFGNLGRLFYNRFKKEQHVDR